MSIRINTEALVPEYTSCHKDYQPIGSNVAYGKPRVFSGSFFRDEQSPGSTAARTVEPEPWPPMRAVEMPEVVEEPPVSVVRGAQNKLVSIWQNRVQRSRREGLESHERCALKHLELACQDADSIVEPHNKVDGLQMLDEIEFAARRLRRILEQ